MAEMERIQEHIEDGLSDRQIARSLKCRRSRVREYRGFGPETNSAQAVAAPTESAEPAWATRVEWHSVLEEIGRGFELKRIWEERVSPATGYPNFWKYLNKRYSWLLQKTVTLREFQPGTHCEVDWAGKRIPWWDARGERREAHVFIGILCHSQLIFAWAASDERKPNWIAAHQKMYSFFGGVPRITVPDNLKTGVSKAHLYDPDLHPAYQELARHYHTAIVPARVKRPRDKALVENAVGIVMRLFRWTYRNHRFHCINEVNEALSQVTTRINAKAHSRFKISRRERFETLERPHLRDLPEQPFQDIEWKTARVHPDCTISIDSATYSVPHLHRGKEVRVKLTSRQIEVFLNLERVALHGRDRSKSGARHLIPEHLPPNAQAYHEATPQNLLSQARFIGPALHAFIEALLKEDALGNLRRAQGFIRQAAEENHRYGRSEAEPRIALAIEQMSRFGQARVRTFKERLEQLRKQKPLPVQDREITRLAGNPMLRGTGAAQGMDQPYALPLQEIPR